MKKMSAIAIMFLGFLLASQAELVNVAFETSATASSVVNAEAKYQAGIAVDGVEISSTEFWFSDAVSPHWWKTDLGHDWSVHSIRVVGRADHPGRVTGMTIGVYTNATATGTPVFTDTITSFDQTFMMPTGVVGRSVKLSGTTDEGSWANVCEVLVYSEIYNAAHNSVASQSTTYSSAVEASNAVDGDTSTSSSTLSGADQWWKTDLGATVPIKLVAVRALSGLLDRIEGCALTLYESADGTGPWVYSNDVEITSAALLQHFMIPDGTEIRSVKISQPLGYTNYLNFVEMSAYSETRDELFIRYTFDDSGNLMADTATDATDHSAENLAFNSYNSSDVAQGTGSSLWNGSGGSYVLPQPAVDDPLNNLLSGITFAFWMKIDGSKTTGMMPLTWDGGTDNTPFSIYVAAGTGDTRAMAYYVNGSSIEQINVETDRWVHISIVHDFFTNKARFYVDGLRQLAGIDMNDMPESTTDYFFIGSRTGQALAFKGGLDDMQVYRHVGETPSDDEVYFLANNSGSTLSEYDGSVAPSSYELIVRYTFDNASSIMEDTSLDIIDHSMAGNMPAQDTGDYIQGAGASLWDGANDYAYYLPSSYDTLNDLGNGLSYCYWVKPDSTGGNYMMTLIWSDNTQPYNTPFAVYFTANDSATLGLNLYVASTTPQCGVSSGIPKDEWTHIAITHDFVSNTAVMYTNGVVASTELNATDVPTSTTRYFRLGDRVSANTRFKGRFDDVQVYRGNVPTADEIAYIYNNPGATLPIPPTPQATIIILQ